MRRYLVLPTFFLLACTAKDDGTKAASTKPTSPQVKTAVPTIASVVLADNCDDPEEKEAAAAPDEGAPAEPAMEAKRMADSAEMDSDMEAGWEPPCVQSMIQISYDAREAESSATEIVEARILDESGKVLMTVPTRSPSLWMNNGYQPWDGKLAGKAESKASYKLTLKSWSEIDKGLGGNSYGKKLHVEVDVKVGGVTTTLRSAPVVRTEPEIVET